jgi:putative transcriptional regulator
VTRPTPAEIRASRERAGLTQTQAGAVIGAALRTWQDWESGARNMPAAKWRLWQLLIADKTLQRL